MADWRRWKIILKRGASCDRNGPDAPDTFGSLPKKLAVGEIKNEKAYLAAVASCKNGRERKRKK
jgi:hypothetical protein